MCILGKKLYLSTIDKIPLKSDCIDGVIQNGLGQLIVFSFNLTNQVVKKFFCEPETIQYKKTNKSVLNTITFYLE